DTERRIYGGRRGGAVPWKIGDIVDARRAFISDWLERKHDMPFCAICAAHSPRNWWACSKWRRRTALPSSRWTRSARGPGGHERATVRREARAEPFLASSIGPAAGGSRERRR